MNSKCQDSGTQILRSVTNGTAWCGCCGQTVQAVTRSGDRNEIPTTLTTVPSQHKHPPIGFRPPEADRAWLLNYAKVTGKPVNQILAEALAAYIALRG